MKPLSIFQVLVQSWDTASLRDQIKILSSMHSLGYRNRRLYAEDAIREAFVNKIEELEGHISDEDINTNLRVSIIQACGRARRFIEKHYAKGIEFKLDGRRDREAVASLDPELARFVASANGGSRRKNAASDRANNGIQHRID